MTDKKNPPPLLMTEASLREELQGVLCKQSLNQGAMIESALIVAFKHARLIPPTMTDAAKSYMGVGAPSRNPGPDGIIWRNVAEAAYDKYCSMRRHLGHISFNIMPFEQQHAWIAAVQEADAILSAARTA